MSPARQFTEALIKTFGGTWTPSKISDIINKKRRITESIALDFGDAFGTSSEFWMNLQYRYDLWVAKQSHKPIARLPHLSQINHSSFKKN